MHGKPKSLGTKADIAVQVGEETERALKLTRRVGKRLNGQLAKYVDALPDEAWCEQYRWYCKAVAELGRLANGTPAGKKDGSDLSPEDYADEMKHIAEEWLRGLSTNELCTLLAELGVADLVNAGSTNAPTGAPSEGFS